MAPQELVWATSDGVSKRGIRWARVVGEIDRLNGIVSRKTAEMVASAQKSGDALSPEVASMVVHPDQRVYKQRWIFMPVFFALTSVSLVLFGGSTSTGSLSLILFGGTTVTGLGARALVILATFLIEFMWYDLFSGVLHVVLDNPDFIGVPILHEPCLEFQWHHHIPLDLTVKSYLEVCGDLNLVVSILFSIYLALGIYYKMNPTFCCLVGWKLLMAYFGQLCHCMSHMPSPYKPKWVNTLQNWGVMISTHEHNQHHKNYDDSFCIGSGVCNPAIKAMRQVSTNKWLWLSMFIVLLLADVPLVNHVLTERLSFP